MESKTPYRLSSAQVAQLFNTDHIRGLTAQQVQRLLKVHGKNALPEAPEKTLFTIFLSQFQSPLIYILLIAAAIIFFVGEHPTDAFIISIVLIFNAIVGTIQEGRTRGIVRQLRRFIKTDTFVVRDSVRQLIEDTWLVPGDLIYLQEGQRVPADARIIESNNIQVDEALLTGESFSVHKIDEALEQELPVSDQRNMVFKGTYVLAGTARAIVTATGIHTEIGGIARTVVKIDTAMPLRRELDHMARWLLVLIFGICIILFFVGALTGKPIQELLAMLTALFICIVPEGLPVVLTLALVTGVYRMAQQGILVKRMQAVEGLGRVDVIAVDKTGTLTRNEMMVSRVVADHMVCTVTGEGYHAAGVISCADKPLSIDPGSAVDRLATACTLLDSAQIDYNSHTRLFTIKGDPTEAAMGVFARKLGYTKETLADDYIKLYEIPFDSRLQYHAGFFEKDGSGLAFIIGSVERIVQWANCDSIAVSQTVQPLLDQGLRVLAVGCKEFSLEQFHAEHTRNHDTFGCCQRFIENNVTLLGFVGIEDAIRQEVRSVVEQVRAAGMRVVMVTGDHQKTALYVAKHVGIFHAGDQMLDGQEFARLSDMSVLQNLEQITVYSRMTPRDKFRLITLFHKKKKLIAMTGDGINDVPPLVAADLGIAMGSIGTEIAKEAADLILLQDSFVTIVEAIKQSRHIFNTLRRVVLYFFSTNLGELFIIMFALFAQLPLPIAAAQILWLNLVTDGFLDVALATEKPEEDILYKKGWLAQKMRLVDYRLLGKMLLTALPMGIGSLGVFVFYYRTNLLLAQTMTLMTMAMFQWFNAWNCRSETKSLFQLGLFINKWLVLTTSLVLILQGFLLYTVPLQNIFRVVPLSLGQWGVIIAVSSPIVLIEEVRKYIANRWYRA